MHLIMLAILIVIALIIIFYKEHFISNFDMIINTSLNPIYTNYNARNKLTPYGDDYIDLRLKQQLSASYLR
jgi:cell shape-determining protein MreC